MRKQINSCFSVKNEILMILIKLIQSKNSSDEADASDDSNSSDEAASTHLDRSFAQIAGALYVNVPRP